MNLYVSNLGNEITDESLRAVFATYGEVSASRIVKQPSVESFGFVEMPNEAEAEKAIKKINGTVVNGRNLSVKESLPRPDVVIRNTNH